MQGFPRDFLGGGGGGGSGGTKNPTPKIAGKLLKEQKTKKIPCAEGAQNFWENFGKKHLKLVFFSCQNLIFSKKLVFFPAF